MLTTTTIYTMDLDTYETLMTTRQQFLNAGATDALIDDLTEEKMDQLRYELHPEWISDEYAEEPTLASEAFDDEWTYTDYLMGN